MIASGTRWRVLAALALVTAQGCWLQAGFDARRSGFNNGETAVTPANVDDLEPAWSAPLGGTPGEPLVYGGTVYLRTPGSVRAFDTASGATRWTATQPGSGEPVVAGDRVWVPTAANVCRLVALDRGTGAVLDTRAFGGPDLSGIPNALSVCLTGDALSVGSKVVVSWSYTGIALAPGPCFPNQTGSHSNGIAGVDIDTPSTGWSAALGGSTTCSLPPLPVPPVPHEAFSSDGSLVYRPLGTGGSVTGYPVACQANCLSTLSWTTPAAVVPVATPLPGDDELAMMATDGRLLVVDAGTGALRWSAVVGGAGAAGEAPPAVTGSTIVATAGDGTVAVLPVEGCGAATCTPTWTAELPAAAAGRPAVGAGVVYVGGEDGTVTALDGAGCGAATCDPLWSATVPGAVTGTVIDGGVVYVASASGGAGMLSTFRLPT